MHSAETLFFPILSKPGAAVTRSGWARTEFEQLCLITAITLADSGVGIQELGRHGFTALIKLVQINP